MNLAKETATKSSRRSSGYLGHSSKALFFILAFAAWEAFVFLGKIPIYLVPAPSHIFQTFSTSYNNILGHTFFTLWETAIGFLAAVALGIILAIVVVHSKYLSQTLLPALVAFNAFPKVAMAPLIGIWFGIGLESKVVMALIIAFFPIVVNGVSGMSEIEPELLDLGRLGNASRWQIFRKIRLPHSLPALFDAFKVSITLATIGAIIGEFVGGNEGLGYLILLATGALNTPLVFASIILTGAVAVLLYFVVVVMERILLGWRPSGRKR